LKKTSLAKNKTFIIYFDFENEDRNRGMGYEMKDGLFQMFSEH